MDILAIARKLKKAKECLSFMTEDNKFHNNLFTAEKDIDFILKNLVEHRDRIKELYDNEFNVYYAFNYLVFDDQCNFIINAKYDTTEEKDQSITKTLSNIYLLTDDNEIKHLICSATVYNGSNYALLQTKRIDPVNMSPSIELYHKTEFIFSPVIKEGNVLKNQKYSIDSVLLPLMVKFISDYIMKYKEYKKKGFDLYTGVASIPKI